MIYVFVRVENIVGKGENAGYWFPTMFSKAIFLRVVLKSWLCGKALNIFVLYWWRNKFLQLIPISLNSSPCTRAKCVGQWKSQSRHLLPGIQLRTLWLWGGHSTSWTQTVVHHHDWYSGCCHASWVSIHQPFFWKFLVLFSWFFYI